MSLISLLLVCIMGLAGAATPQDLDPNPILGTWTYRIDAPDRIYTGTLVFAMQDDQVVGQMTSNQSIGALTVSHIAFDPDTRELTFFVSGPPESGELDAYVTVEDRVFYGSLDNLTYEVYGMAFKGHKEASL